MDVLARFMVYAADFERTFRDDDWSRLRKHFADDAVYEVVAESFGGKLEGPDAIFKGMKKSLDGFDRKFSGRGIAITSGPVIEDSALHVGWEVTYTKEGLSPFVLKGRSNARIRDGKIVHLVDSYEPAVERELAAWQRDNGVELDASYV